VRVSIELFYNHDSNYTLGDFADNHLFLKKNTFNLRLSLPLQIAIGVGREQSERFDFKRNIT